MAKSSTVFVSYAHGNQRFQDRILAFADRLELLGLELVFDQYEPNPGQGWTKWMLDGIERSEYVLCLCTNAYLERVNERQKPATGLGAQWEGTILYNLLQSEPIQRNKVQVVQFDAADAEAVPIPIRGNNRFVIKDASLDDEQFRSLYRVLTDQNIRRPMRGQVIELGHPERISDSDIQVLPARERLEIPRSGVNSSESNLGFQPLRQEVTTEAYRSRPDLVVSGKGTYLQRLARKRVESALTAIDNDDYYEAIRLATEASTLDGSLTRPYAILAAAYFDTRRWQEAGVAYAACNHRGVAMSELDIMRWHIAKFHAGSLPEDRDRIEEIAETNQNDVDISSAFCYFLDDIGERPVAKTLLKGWLHTRTDVNLMETLAIIEWRDGNVAEATSLLEEATKMNPKSPLMWANLGVGRAEMRRFGLAIEALRRSLLLRPKFQFVGFALAEVYAMMGDVEASIEPLRDLVAIRYYQLHRVRTERTFDPIRESPAFQQFLATIPEGLLRSPA